MEKIDTEKFKKLLLAEKAKLIAELQTVGRINPDNPNDWEATPGEKDENTADSNEFADTIEKYESNTALVKELEIQLIDINAALEKIKNGTYGICEVSGDQIEMDRLTANPSAKTCKQHLEN